MAGRRGVLMRVLICGGGVIGTSIAYFLGQRGIEAVVIERTGIANAASGKSGGFLALDWCDGSPVEPLARRSFALHAELAETIDDEWGYRRLDTLGVVASARRDVGSFRRLDGPGWLAQDSAVHRRLGTSETTAQVNPADFTKAMMRAAIGAGARLLMGSVSGLVFGEGGGVRGAVVDGQEVAGDAVVIAMGPWSVLASRWLPLPAIYGLKGHSVVFRYTPEPVPHALFVELETATGDFASPEVYPRPDGTTYVCGLSSEAPLPVDPAAVAPEEGGAARLHAMTAQVVPALGDVEVLAEQACYRPVVEDGLPLIGAVPSVDGAYVATAHSVWGMLNGPATGEAVAELIADGASRTVNLAPFSPARLAPLPADAVRTEI